MTRYLGVATTDDAGTIGWWRTTLIDASLVITAASKTSSILPNSPVLPLEILRAAMTNSIIGGKP